ncbi:hypothetical protein BH09ACT12_BH09ACT12_08210 [soil metagenome]
MSAEGVAQGPSGELSARIARRDSGLLLFGMTPPRRSLAGVERQCVADVKVDRLMSLDVDALVLYDIADEADRIADDGYAAIVPGCTP